jgi:hypothetical protein
LKSRINVIFRKRRLLRILERIEGIRF